MYLQQTGEASDLDDSIFDISDLDSSGLYCSDFKRSLSDSGSLIDTSSLSDVNSLEVSSLSEVSYLSSLM